MFTTLLIAAAAVASVQPVSLVAPASPAGSASTAAPASAPMQTKAVEPRYCIIDAPAGSRIARKFCETRADWAFKGVTIP